MGRWGRAWSIGGVSVGAFLVAVVVGAAGIWIALDRSYALREARMTAWRYAHVLAEQTERTVQIVDLMLAQLGEALAADPDRPDNDPVFQDRMRALLTTSPFIRALFVIGPDGYITQDTDYPHTPRRSLADRDYFVAHEGGEIEGLYIGAPLRSRSAGGWFVGVSRRIPTADGSFAGVVAAAIEPRYFEQFYSDAVLERTDSIALFGRDGTLLARHPTSDAVIGTSYALHEPFRSMLAAASAGTLGIHAVTGGAARIFAYRAVGDLPLVVTVGLDKEAVLAAWTRRAMVVAAGAGGIPLWALLALLLFLRHRRQRAEVERQCAQVQKLDAVGQMAAGIVHDFRNLLAVVSSGVGLLRRRATDSSLMPILDQLDSTVERGASLASHLLAISREQELDLEVVDLNELMRTLHPVMAAAGSGLRLRLDPAPGLWWCRIDHTQLDCALLNLIINARDAMERGGEIRLSTANCPARSGLAAVAVPPGDHVRLSVADTGRGMSPAVLRRALEPFYTTKGGEGTGLGLSQVYGFVRQVGGHVTIRSEPGAGTTVDLYFPRCAAPAREAAPRPAAEDPHPAADSMGEGGRP